MSSARIIAALAVGVMIAGCSGKSDDKKGKGAGTGAKAGTGSATGSVVDAAVAVRAPATDPVARVQLLGASACACTNKACGDGVFVQVYELIAELRTRKISPFQAKEFRDAMEQVGRCLTDRAKGGLRAMEYAGMVVLAAKKYEGVEEVTALAKAACKCKAASCGVTVLNVLRVYLARDRDRKLEPEQVDSVKKSVRKLGACVAKVGVPQKLIGQILIEATR